MVTCPSCATVLFVDMEGVAHAASEDPAASIPQQLPTDTFGTPDSHAEPDDQGVGMGLESLQMPPPDQPMEPAPAADLNMEAFLGYESPDADATSDSTQNDPNDPLGISAYANSELSSAKDGPLVVTVIISGIDTKDLRLEIRQALQDSRFGWDAGSLMSTVRGGTLRLERISPVKATIVINRIKNLAVQIRWEQSAITELDISGSDSSS